MKVTNEISENLLINAKKLLTNDNPIKTERVYIKPIYFSLNSTGHNLLQIKIVLWQQVNFQLMVFQLKKNI